MIRVGRYSAGIVAGVLALACSQSACAGSAPPDTRAVVMVGHSLVNFDMPRMLAVLAEDAGHTHLGGAQVLVGANLQWNWNHSADSAFNARVELPTGHWDTLVLTEAVPLDNHLMWSDTFAYAGQFHALALSANAQTQTYIYETWHCIHSGTPTGCDWDDHDDIPWRQRLSQDLPKWQSIATHLNANFAGPPVRLVPAGQAMALLHDRIAAGQVPGYTHVFQLFGDSIHLTDAGNYFVALVMYATLYERSPEGLTREISNPWGTPYALPPPATALALQRLAWQGVATYFGWQVQSDAVFADGFEAG